MRALIVYESMYGNTHVIAERIAEGLRPRFEVEVVAVDKAGVDEVAKADLLVVGGPTHVHTMSSERSRQAAKDATDKPGSILTLEAEVASEGLRDWFHELPPVTDRAAAAFDTRLDGPAIVTGRASRAIEKRLRKLGFGLVADPESFLVDKQTELVAGEADRAVKWAKELAESVSANP